MGIINRFIDIERIGKKVRGTFEKLFLKIILFSEETLDDNSLDDFDKESRRKSGGPNLTSR